MTIHLFLLIYLVLLVLSYSRKIFYNTTFKHYLLPEVLRFLANLALDLLALLGGPLVPSVAPDLARLGSDIA